MRDWHPMHLFLLAALCSSAISCRRDTRGDNATAIRAATREWNAAEAAKDLENAYRSTPTMARGLLPGRPPFVGPQRSATNGESIYPPRERSGGTRQKWKFPDPETWHTKLVDLS
jgi:hypothetical protein